MPNTLLYVLTVLIWGSTWYAITFQIGHAHPLISISYRFFIAAVVLFIYLGANGRFKNMKFSKRQHAFIALQGLFLFCLNYWLNYVGTGYLTSGMVSIIFSTLTLMNIFNQRIFFKIKVKNRLFWAFWLDWLGLLPFSGPKSNIYHSKILFSEV